MGGRERRPSGGRQEQSKRVRGLRAGLHALGRAGPTAGTVQFEFLWRALAHRACPWRPSPWLWGDFRQGELAWRESDRWVAGVGGGFGFLVRGGLTQDLSTVYRNRPAQPARPHRCPDTLKYREGSCKNTQSYPDTPAHTLTHSQTPAHLLSRMARSHAHTHTLARTRAHTGTHALVRFMRVDAHAQGPPPSPGPRCGGDEPVPIAAEPYRETISFPFFHNLLVFLGIILFEMCHVSVSRHRFAVRSLELSGLCDGIPHPERPRRGSGPSPLRFPSSSRPILPAQITWCPWASIESI